MIDDIYITVLHSAFSILHFTLSLHFISGLQSAV